MFKKLKKITVQMIAGANVATVLMMLLIGYSDRINPAEHPLLSTLGMAFPFFLFSNTYNAGLARFSLASLMIAS